MKILIVAATEEETQFLKNNTATVAKQHQLNFLHTGVGMALTAYVLTKELMRNTYDLVINVGIAGSFSNKLEIGEVVNVVSDVFAELGAEDDTNFIKFSEMKLPGCYLFENNKTLSGAYFNSLKKVKAATVNKVHGNEATIETFLKIHAVAIESMEGAAVAMVCELEKIPYVQIRCISNFVTKRDREKWNIPLAIKNLNEGIQKIVNEL